MGADYSNTSSVPSRLRNLSVLSVSMTSLYSNAQNHFLVKGWSSILMICEELSILSRCNACLVNIL